LTYITYDLIIDISIRKNKQKGGEMRKKGFTLIEIMVVMAIIAVLAVLVIGAVQLARSTATETQHRSNAKTLQTALEANYAKAKAYCGNTGAPACAAGSFATVAAGFTNPAISLNTSSSAGTCAAGGASAGGGKVIVLTANSYRLAPGNSGCTGVSDASDIIDVSSGSAVNW
jgi:prepilin-type N-terminal cleavage/methylation domain-containing protein